MTLEHQVIPLPMAQRLKELGVKQESLFSWIKHKQTAFPEPMIYYVGQVYEDKEEFGDGPRGLDVLAAAFTVAELGEIMPLGYDTMRTTADDWQGESWRAYDIYGKDCPDKEYSTEAEARGAMLIHLLESNLITIEEVNSRI